MHRCNRAELRANPVSPTWILSCSRAVLTPELVDVTHGTASTTYPITFNYTGAFTAEARGLVLPEVRRVCESALHTGHVTELMRFALGAEIL